VRVQPVVAHADAKAGRDVIQQHRHSQICPTEHEQSGNRSNMKEEKHGTGDPVQFITRRNFYEICTQSSPDHLLM
jgi:hypothetical protein